MAVDPARARLRELSDFAAPWAVWVAATLRLADHVGSGATTLDELAERAGADPNALRRLLQYLLARGVFTEQDGAYANNDLSRLLQTEGGWRPWLDLDDAPGIWAESWTRLLQAIRTGSPGRDEGWHYQELERTGRSASFDALMEAQVRAKAEEAATAYDWSQIEHVVDIGGGNGALLRILLAAHPHLRGTLFDQPRVVANAAEAERLEAVGGDLFHDRLPSGDVYVLSQILHGWPDRGAAQILERCAQAGGAGVRMLLIESLLSDPPTADEASFDLFMLAGTGGRQRSLEDFRRLAEPVGLVVSWSQLLTTGNSLVELREAQH